MPRERLFCIGFLLLALNALARLVRESIVAHGGAWAALNLFDISAIVWLAIAAGTALLWHAKPEQARRRGDSLILTGTIIAALLPFSTASSAMLTALALWGYLTSNPATALRRSSAIFLGVTTSLLWGRVLLELGAGPFLRADASFVGLISGMQSSGNVVNFSDGTFFRVASGCSSFHGVSLALVLWNTVLQYFRIRLDFRMWLGLLLATAGSIAVNGARLSTIAWNPQEFDYWHSETGAALFGWIALMVITAAVYWGAAHARRAT